MRTILFILLAFSATSAMAQYHGHYYTTSGEKINGYISITLHENYIYFRTDEKGHSEKISINNIQALVTYNAGVIVDSLVVLTEKGDESKRYFAKPIVASKVTSFYYKFKFNHWGDGSDMHTSYSPTTTSIAQGNQSSVNPNVTWSAFHSKDIVIPMYSDNGTTYELTKSNFKDILGKAFADDTDLANQINSGDLKFKYLSDMFSIYEDFLDSKKSK